MDEFNFTQGELNFDAPGGEAGFHLWQEDLRRKQAEFERKWGVVLGSKVRVDLTGRAAPVEGLLHFVRMEKAPKGGKPRMFFEIGGKVFERRDIVGIVRVD